jgi:predicted transglutaminase-like cysteine proteinase
MQRVFWQFLVVALAAPLLSACVNPATGAIGPAIPSITDEAMPTNISAGHFMPSGLAKADVPIGYIGFCVRLPDQCKISQDTPATIALTPQSWTILTHTNHLFNESIRPMDDERHYGIQEYWTIPADGYGDCEDAALAKRQALINQGLPASALRIAVAVAPGFGRHALLTVATNEGDYVLDNMTQRIRAWDDTGYNWIEHQDPKTGWVSLQPGNQLVADANTALPVGVTR